MRIGVDVGGTNTDAVAMQGRTVLGAVKSPTTEDVTSGVVNALTALLEDHRLDPAHVTAVMIGTTHFTNAVVEARGLAPTAAIRLALPATTALPPLVDWPDRLRQAIEGQVYLCHGGHEFDGRTISDLDHDELRRVASEAADRGVRSVAITSVFSPINAEMEVEAADVIQREAPELLVSLSSEVGRVGLLERENAVVMNACLRPLAATIVHAFRTAIAALGIDAPLYISQNDGTLMSAEYTEQYPVATFASGPTNSMRGAAFLSDVQDAAVVDVGGTTADIGMLVAGFPREASVAVDIGGVRTNFRMPDVLSIGIGGGSRVHRNGAVTVGPDSVGFRLTEESQVFGGGTLTATDIAVAAGLADLGDPSRVRDLDDGLVAAGLRAIQDAVDEIVDQMKTSAEPIPVVVVGGGSILLADEIAGASEVIRPPHHGVANAIGAAIAQVGGETDRIYSLTDMTRDEALADATRQATEAAVGAGADPESVRVVDVDDVPLAYLPSSAIRIRVKAVGDLAE